MTRAAWGAPEGGDPRVHETRPADEPPGELALPPRGARAERLEADWPGEFRRSALPLIDEEAFRDLYHEWNGRPNKPVRTVVGVLLLKEMFNLTDAEALGALDYDLRWHTALDLQPEEAHCSRKMLHNFRAKLMKSDKAKVLFEEALPKVL